MDGDQYLDTRTLDNIMIGKQTADRGKLFKAGRRECPLVPSVDARDKERAMASK